MWPLRLSTTIVVQLLLITSSSWAVEPPAPQVQAMVNRMFEECRVLIAANQQLYLETLYSHFGDQLFHTPLTVMLHDLNLIPYTRRGRDRGEDQANRALDDWRANNQLDQVSHLP